MPFRDEIFSIYFACFQRFFHFLFLQPVIIHYRNIGLQGNFCFLPVAHHMNVNRLVFIQVEVEPYSEYRE